MAVEAPATERAAGHQRAVVPGPDGERAHVAADRHVPGRGGRLVVPDRGDVPVAELALARLSPTAHRSTGEERAGVVLAAAGEGDRRADLDVAGGAGGLVVPDRGDVPVAELAVGPTSPAAERPAGVEGARVIGAAGHGGRHAGERHVAGRHGELVISDVARNAVAELALHAVTPTAQAAAREGRTVVVAGGHELRDRATDRDRAGGGGRFGVADRVGVAVAELAV